MTFNHFVTGSNPVDLRGSYRLMVDYVFFQILDVFKPAGLKD